MTPLQKTKEIDSLIADVERKLSEIDKQRSTLQESLANLKQQKTLLEEQTSSYTSLSAQHSKVTNHSS
jgi:prefoldin subunit 5